MNQVTKANLAVKNMAKIVAMQEQRLHETNTRLIRVERENAHLRSQWGFRMQQCIQNISCRIVCFFKVVSHA
jgi:hypothetical protein